MNLGRWKETSLTARSGRLWGRRAFLKRALLLGTAVPIFSRFVACGGGGNSRQPAGSAPSAAPTEPSYPGTYGGVLRVGLIGEIPTFDIHQTTASMVALVTWHIYEPLFTWDEHFQVLPHLAQSHEISDDGLTHVVRLRRGVTFHNGEEMRASDVIASIQRWGSIVGLGAGLLHATDEIVEIDNYTIEFRLNQPFGTLAIALARGNQGCAIYPKSVIERGSAESLTEFIGTGPYRFIEHQADRFILLQRFEDYAPPPGGPNGYGGYKAQYVDAIEFLPAPDEAARIAGLQTGAYHYLESLSADHFEILSNDPNVVVTVSPPEAWLNFVLNARSPLFSDRRLRSAFQAALDHEPIMQAGYGTGFFRLDPSLVPDETVWHTTAGVELYDRNDPDTARKLLAEAGYDGEPLRFMTTQEYRFMYNASLVAKQQLEAVGFNVDLRVTDWATLVDRRNDPGGWDVYTASASFRPDPIMRNLTCQATGWWCNEDKDALLEELQAESDFEARFAIWEQIQQLFYEDAPRIKLGDSKGIIVRSPDIHGFPSITQLQPDFSNVWLAE